MGISWLVILASFGFIGLLVLVLLWRWVTLSDECGQPEERKRIIEMVESGKIKMEEG